MRHMALLSPWMAYHWAPEGDDRVLAQHCLDVARGEFSADERAWIDVSLAEPQGAGNGGEWLDAETATRWAWLQAGNAKHASWSNTALGHLHIDGAMLLGECNSEGADDAGPERGCERCVQGSAVDHGWADARARRSIAVGWK